MVTIMFLTCALIYIAYNILANEEHTQCYKVLVIKFQLIIV